MKLLILFGPPAVGKLTVAEILEKQTDFKLFHNHMITDGLMKIFGANSPSEDKLSRLIREAVIGEAAEAGIDLIFTYVWNFLLPKGKNNIDAYKAQYESRGGEVIFVELDASREVRMNRAEDPERYKIKPNTVNADDIAGYVHDRFTSPTPFYFPENYFKIDTNDKSPQQVADEILNLNIL
ncbi:MAG TPA: hypothetical protein VLG47_04845 [Candidatus Saccharimonadales bacterium]|nr:hypothetical protein [Candidatus Saccharimonadales bacterium]